MAEKEESQEGKAAEAQAPKKGKKKLIIIMAAAVLILAGAGVPLFMMGGAKEGEEATTEEEHHEDAHEGHLATAAPDVFVVNLSETGAFLKVRMLLEYDEGTVKKFEEELTKKGLMGEEGGGHAADATSKSTLSGYMKHREPMIRDSVIRILSSRRANDVLSLVGKEKLKEEIIEGINEALAMDDSPVQAVYFQEFIIQ